MLDIAILAAFHHNPNLHLGYPPVPMVYKHVPYENCHTVTIGDTGGILYFQTNPSSCFSLQVAIVVGTAVALRKVHCSAGGICAAAPPIGAKNLGTDRALQPRL